MTARRSIAGLVAFAALAFAAPARATSGVKNCSQLQEALTFASAGDTITLDQMCHGAFTLPDNVSFTLTGLAGSGAGFDGTGVSGPVLYGPSVGGSSAGATFTLSSLTVQNTAAVSAPVLLGAAGAGGITVQNMRFTNNAASETSGYGAGGLLIQDGYCPSSAATSSPITVEGSTFNGNAVATAGTAYGGGATIVPGYPGCAYPRPVVVTNNVFSSNQASSSATSSAFLGAVGGGLAVVNQSNAIAPLTQSGNTFVGNSVTGSGGATSNRYGGGGAWTQGMDLTSSNDSFIGNTATGATGAGNWTWGAGLSIVNSSCTQANHTVSTATNLVAAGNIVIGGAPADVLGAGIYTGCDPGTGSDLTLQDSTVSGNSSVAGSVAGIGGEAVDRLLLLNTIDTGNTGGDDLGGFNATGPIIANYSDVCASGTGLPGPGNICAAPALASATDVHETAASPTIDEGANALVPSGFAADAFGTTRVLAGNAVCSAPFPPAIVDMGAAEYVPPNPSCPNPMPKPTPSPLVTRASFGNQLITVTTPSPRTCTKKRNQLAVKVTSTRKSTGTKLKFSKITFFLDKGIKHTIHKTAEGKKKVFYTANLTVHRVPITVGLALAGLKSGKHTLKVVLSYKETKRGKHGTKKTITVTKTLRAKFTVC